MFSNIGPFQGIISSYRLLWILGRFGGHKTSLSYALARPYLERGYRLISNNRSCWSDDPERVQLDPKTGHLKAVVILDEGGLYFKSSKQIEMVASYAAKMDVIYIIPSFWPPTRAAQVLMAQPVFNFKSAGLPVVVYQWRVNMAGFKSNGYFLWIWPQEIYGIYSRQDPGDTSDKVVEFLIKRTEEYRSRFGYSNSFSSMASEVSEADLLLEATEGMAQAADTMASIPSRKHFKR